MEIIRYEEVKLVSHDTLEKLADENFDNLLSKEEKELLVHQLINKLPFGGRVDENIYAVLSAGNVPNEDILPLAHMILDGQVEINGFWDRMYLVGLEKALLKNQDELSDVAMGEILDTTCRISEITNEHQKINLLDAIFSLDKSRWDSETGKKLENVRSECEKKQMENLVGISRIHDAISCLGREKTFPEMAELTFQKYMEMIKDDGLLAYYLNKDIDKIYKYSKAEELLKGAVSHLEVAASFLKEKDSKEGDVWRHEEYIPRLVENAYETIRKEMGRLVDKIDDYKSFSELFDVAVNENDIRKLFQIFDRIRNEEKGEIKAGIWLSLAGKMGEDHEGLNLKLMVEASGLSLSDLPELIGDASSVEILKILLDYKESFAEPIALALSQMDASKLPESMYQKIDTVILDAKMALEAVHDGWFLCDEAEEKLLKVLKGKVMLVNDSLLLKFEGKIAGLGLKSFTLRCSGQTFLAGVWYCPTDEQLRSDLESKYKKGELVADIDSGTWVVMRAVEQTANKKVSASKVIERANLSAENCRQKKKLTRGAKQRAAHLEEIHDME